MSKNYEPWIRLLGITTIALCLMLVVVPLYFVVVFDGQSYWSTLFGIPSDLVGLSVSEPRSIILAMRIITALSVVGVIVTCTFSRFRFRWLPPAFGALAAEVTLRWLYPKLNNPPGVVHRLGFSLLIVFAVLCVAISTIALIDSALRMRRVS